MAVPPTSPLRTLPQPVAVDVQGFMPQADLFQQAMGAYEKGMKLPLLQEQIKTEKMRNKLERDKLKLAEQYLVEDDARARAISAATLAELQLKSDPAVLAAQRAEAERKRKLDEANQAKIEAETKKLEAETRGERFVDRGKSGGALVGETLNDGQLADTNQPQDEDEELGLESTSADGSVLQPTSAAGSVLQQTPAAGSVLQPPVTDFTNFGTRVIKSPSEINVVKRVDPTIADSDVYIPSFNSRRGPDKIKVIELPGPLGNRDATAYASKVAAERLKREFPPFQGKEKDEEAYNQKKGQRAIELEEKYLPTPSTISLTDDNNVPILLDVVKVGNDVVDVIGEPRIDIKNLSEPDKNRDIEFSKMIGGSEYVRQKVNREANIEAYVNAATYLAQAGESVNPADSRIAGLLPPSVLNLFESNRAKARNEARRVLQQQLRETLGGSFAFQEGENMLNTGFNFLFNDKDNLALIRDGARRMLTLGREYDRAEQYYRKNRTLAGFSFNNGLVNEHPILSKFDDVLERISQDPASRQAATQQKETDAAKRETLNLFNNRRPLGTRS